MCKSTGYITEKFCQQSGVLYREEIARHVAVPVAFGMVLATNHLKYGSVEHLDLFNQRMRDIYLRDCFYYDKIGASPDTWETQRKVYYDTENYQINELG